MQLGPGQINAFPKVLLKWNSNWCCLNFFSVFGIYNLIKSWDEKNKIKNVNNLSIRQPIHFLIRFQSSPGNPGIPLNGRSKKLYDLIW
jgi:hypothetical protein